jgi:succinate dehydrogenase / fumarate reductase membrane anchor subunit
MVKSVLAFGQNGVSDWLWQRISAVILGLYFSFIFVYILLHPHVDYTMWQALFHHTTMRIFTLLALISLLIHSWIGIWTVITDYIKCFCLRLFLQIAVVLTLIVYLFWGIQILWGV